MHKNPHQNAENGIKETLFFKIFLGSMPSDPPRDSAPPPKFLNPYAYAQNTGLFSVVVLVMTVKSMLMAICKLLKHQYCHCALLSINYVL